MRLPLLGVLSCFAMACSDSSRSVPGAASTVMVPDSGKGNGSADAGSSGASDGGARSGSPIPPYDYLDLGPGQGLSLDQSHDVLFVPYAGQATIYNLDTAAIVTTLPHIPSFARMLDPDHVFGGWNVGHAAHAFLYEGGTWADLTKTWCVPGYDCNQDFVTGLDPRSGRLLLTRALSIDGVGAVQFQAALWTGSAVEPVRFEASMGVRASYSAAMNASGESLVNADTARGPRPFVLLADNTLVPVEFEGWGEAINTHRIVVGASLADDGRSLPAMWSADGGAKWCGLGEMRVQTRGELLAINEEGTAVGHVDSDAVICDKGILKNLDEVTCPQRGCPHMWFALSITDDGVILAEDSNLGHVWVLRPHGH